MNYNPKIYAMAFCEAIAIAKSKGDKDRCVNNLLALVRANRDQKKLKNIFLAVEKIISRKTEYRKLIIETARPLSSANKETIKAIIKPTDMVENRIDSRLIAGVKININDELQFDGSFAAKIKKILIYPVK